MAVQFQLLGKTVSTDPPTPPAGLPAYVTEPLERQDPAALEAVRDYVDDLLAYHSTTDTHPLASDDLAADGEEVVDVDTADGGTTVVKKVPCGKDCAGCPHGPYVYTVRRHGDTLDWEYQGKYPDADAEE